MNPALKPVIESISRLETFAENPFEAWDSILYKGAFTNQFFQEAITCLELFEENGCPDSCALWLDEVKVSLEELRLVEREIRPPQEWQFRLNKDRFLNEQLGGEEDIRQVFFCSIEAYRKWAAEEIQPFIFNEELFHGGKPLKIFVNGLRGAFGGPHLAVCPIEPTDLPNAWLGVLRLPSDSRLRTHVHVAAIYDARLEPASFLLNWGAINSQDAEPFRKLCVMSLAACLIQDLFDIDRVALNGVKNLQLPLMKEGDSAPSAEQLRELLEAVEWVFSENSETRVLLLVDRLSLDIPDDSSFVAGICGRIKEALDQAKNKYRYVIRERKDEHAKELAALQGDIRRHTDSFANKVRGLLSSLLRDILAALLLLGIGLFARFIKDVSVLSSPEAGLLFKALSIYFFISIALQAWVQLRDISLSKKEILYWANITRNHMGYDDVVSHINSAIEDRKYNFYWQGGLISLLYICLGLLAWNLQAMLKHWGLFQ